MEVQNSLKEEIRRFLDYLYKKKSTWTLYSYATRLSIFEEWLLQNNKDYKNLTYEDAEEFVNFLKNTYSPRSINAVLTALRKFYAYLEKKRVCENIFKEIEGVKIGKRLIQPLNEKEIKILFSQLREKKYRVAFMLMLYGGLRVSEVVNVKREDFLDTDPLSLRVIGKGDKERITYIINKEAEKEIKNYIKDRK